MKSAVIVAAARAPLGRLLGASPKYSVMDLAVMAARPLLDGIGPESIRWTIFGSVLSVGQGQNPARQAALRLGVPIDRPASTVNMVCGSGMRGGAIVMGHPIGASGARIIGDLVQGHQRGETHRSPATTCVGGGMGAAVAFGSV
jgi:acetyl-CoA acetyltransferase